MAPILTVDDARISAKPATERRLVDRSFVDLPYEVVSSFGNLLTLSSGQTVYDATGGAAVACIGHGNVEVKEAIIKQLEINSYCNSLLFSTHACGELADLVIESTGNLMSRVYFCCSGSEATEAMLKFARQYFLELETPQPLRTKFIAREHSYHGNTLGALSLSGHVARRELYQPLLSTNVSWVPACNAYRQRLASESDSEFVAKKEKELNDEFQRVGPETVCAFVAEPVSGASLGCVPYVPGYLSAMKRVCKKYGALFVLDEVMCGMGRTGTMHAWQGEHEEGNPERDCVPDLQMVGKGLGGGYAAIAGTIVGKEIIDVLSRGKKGGGMFMHGQTYQALPLSCAAGLAVQKIIRRENLVVKVREIGPYLEQELKKELEGHQYVGDIRGKGLFWGVELVQNKETREPFETALNVSGRIKERALQEENITFYHGQGTMNGLKGDHLIVAPMYNATKEDIVMIVQRLKNAIEGVFEEMTAAGQV